MKKIIKRFISQAVQNDHLWTVFDNTVLRLTRYAERERINKKTITMSVQEAINKLFPDGIVKHGVFKGMKYLEMESIGSELFPKLLGSYESEIEPVLKKICRSDYTEIVNIGCSEGYYAVGLAMRIPSAIVYAYDNNEKAIRLCKNMSQLNGVEHRIFTGSFCDVEVLKTIPFTKRGLIISDCEGYEKVLFTEEIAQRFAKHDFLIEIHDFVDITISSLIRQRFKKTHKIDVTESIDDIRKAQTYSYEELEGFNLETRKSLLREGRLSIMEWYFMTPRDK